jgi:hypothetical protein
LTLATERLAMPMADPGVYAPKPEPDVRVSVDMATDHPGCGLHDGNPYLFPKFARERVAD